MQVGNMLKENNMKKMMWVFFLKILCFIYVYMWAYLGYGIPKG
jgi:uncharacterized membrane protein (DUF106 family)